MTFARAANKMPKREARGDEYAVGVVHSRIAILYAALAAGPPRGSLTLRWRLFLVVPRGSSSLRTGNKAPWTQIEPSSSQRDVGMNSRRN